MAARPETKLVQVESKLDLVLAELHRELPALRKEMADVRGDNKANRWTVIITVIGATIAALAALWATKPTC